MNRNDVLVGRWYKVKAVIMDSDYVLNKIGICVEAYNWGKYCLLVFPGVDNCNVNSWTDNNGKMIRTTKRQSWWVLQDALEEL